MTIAKLSAEDLKKLAKRLESSKYAAFVQISMDGPKISFTFEDIDGKLSVVNLFDTSTQVSASITRTESL